MTSLRSFSAAAQFESFTQAATVLNVTQGAVSRQIRELELAVGFSLFRRVGRSVQLTRAGRNFAIEIDRELLGLKSVMTRAIQAGDEHRVLRLAVLPTFGNRYLLPRLSSFTKQNPQIRLNIATRDKPVDLIRERFDIAIHFGAPDWPEAEHRLLCSETLVAVASPEFVKKTALQTLEQLPKLPLLKLETRPEAWEEWFKSQNIAAETFAPSLECDQFAILITAAMHGLGAALLPTYLIEEELRTGSLVNLGNETVTTQNCYFIVRPKGDENEDATALSNWLVSCVSGGEALGV